MIDSRTREGGKNKMNLKTVRKEILTKQKDGDIILTQEPN